MEVDLARNIANTEESEDNLVDGLGQNNDSSPVVVDNGGEGLQESPLKQESNVDKEEEDEEEEEDDDYDAYLNQLEE